MASAFARGENLEASECERFAGSKGASTRAELGPERVSGRVTRRGARVRSAARSATAGDCGDARDEALLQARECAIFFAVEKHLLVLKMQLFITGGPYEFGTRFFAQLFLPSR